MRIYATIPEVLLTDLKIVRNIGINGAKNCPAANVNCTIGMNSMNIKKRGMPVHRNAFLNAPSPARNIPPTVIFCRRLWHAKHATSAESSTNVKNATANISTINADMVAGC